MRLLQSPVHRRRRKRRVAQAEDRRSLAGRTRAAHRIALGGGGLCHLVEDGGNMSLDLSRTDLLQEADTGAHPGHDGNGRHRRLEAAGATFSQGDLHGTGPTAFFQPIWGRPEFLHRPRRTVNDRHPEARKQKFVPVGGDDVGTEGNDVDVQAADGLHGVHRHPYPAGTGQRHDLGDGRPGSRDRR